MIMLLIEKFPDWKVKKAKILASKLTLCELERSKEFLYLIYISQYCELSCSVFVFV